MHTMIASNRFRLRVLLGLASAALLGSLSFGCALQPESAPGGAAVGEAGGEGTADRDEPTGTAAQAIKNGVPATSFFSTRAVQVVTQPYLGLSSFSFGTGTIISPRHVLTAAHTKAFPFINLNGQTAGTTVNFYGNSATPIGSAAVTRVQVAPGVDPPNDQYDDNNGDFADFAVLTLATPIPATSMVATLSHRYGGQNLLGTLVGAGGLNGNPNPQNILFMTSGFTHSSSDGGGYFYLNAHYTDGGDSGGPFYVGGQELGVLHGYAWDYGQSAYVSEYTSVPYFLDTILGMIGFSTTLSTFANTGLHGTVSESFFATQRVCAYACENSSSCQGFTENGILCSLFSSVTGTFSLPGVTSGKK